MKNKMVLIIGLILSLNLIFTSVQAEVIPTPEEELYANMEITMGDLDHNGQVNASDALTMLKFAVGKIEDLNQTFPTVYSNNMSFEADLNGDGSVDAVDALLALKIAVNKYSPKYANLSNYDWNTSIFDLGDKTQYEPKLLTSLDENVLNSVPKEMRSYVSEFDFEHSSLILFSDLANISFVPTVCQVATNGTNCLVRYRYTNELSNGQHLLALSVPKDALTGVKNIFVSQVEWEDSIVSTGYTFERECEQQVDLAQQTVVIKDTNSADEFLSYFKTMGLSMPDMECFVKYRNHTGYYENHILVITCDIGIHGSTQSKYTINSITTEGTTAMIDYTILPPENDDGELNARRSLLVTVWDLPKTDVGNCNTFIFKSIEEKA